MSFFNIQNKRFECSEALAVFRGVRRQAMATLWGSFGESRVCLSRWYRQCTPRRCVQQIHMSNESARRLNRMARGDLLKTHSVGRLNRALERGTKKVVAAYVRRAEEIRESLGTRPRVTPILSLGLEDAYTEAAAARLAYELRKVWPYQISRNPLSENAKDSSDVDFIEYHGLRLSGARPSERACIFSNDGHDIDLGSQRRILRSAEPASTMFARIRQARKHCDHVFTWWNHQGGADRGGVFIPPRERHSQIYRQDISTLNSFLRRHYAN